LYGLTSQIRRAVVSVPANIAEGASRQHKRDYLQFLYIARASLAEIECLLRLANRVEHLSEIDFERINKTFGKLAKTLYGLIASVEKETNSPVRV
jgi:four helix bundle protein